MRIIPTNLLNANRIQDMAIPPRAKNNANNEHPNPKQTIRLQIKNPNRRCNHENRILRGKKPIKTHLLLMDQPACFRQDKPNFALGRPLRERHPATNDTTYQEMTPEHETHGKNSRSIRTNDKQQRRSFPWVGHQRFTPRHISR